MPFLVTVELFDLEDVLFFLFDDIDVSTYYRKVITTISLAFLVPKTSLMVLVFLANLALMSGRLLVLATRYVSRRNISRFSLFGVFLFLFCGFSPLGTFQINLPGAKESCSNAFASLLTAFSTASS